MARSVDCQGKMSSVSSPGSNVRSSPRPASPTIAAAAAEPPAPTPELVPSDPAGATAAVAGADEPTGVAMSTRPAREPVRRGSRAWPPEPGGPIASEVGGATAPGRSPVADSEADWGGAGAAASHALGAAAPASNVPARVLDADARPELERGSGRQELLGPWCRGPLLGPTTVTGAPWCATETGSATIALIWDGTGESGRTLCGIAAETSVSTWRTIVSASDPGLGSGWDADPEWTAGGGGGGEEFEPEIEPPATACGLERWELTGEAADGLEVTF